MPQTGPRARRTAEIKPREDRRLLGIMMVMGAFLLFTGIDTSAKWLVLSGLPSMEVVFARYSVHLVILAAWFLPAFGTQVFHTNAPVLELGRALVLLASTIFNFFAVKYLPLTVTGSIIFASPILLSVLSIPLLGESIGWRRWLAIFVGFVGVLIIVQPGGASFHPAMLLSLGAVTSYALYNIANRKLAGVDSPYAQQMYAALLATLFLLPFAFSGWVWPSDPASWVAFFAMGVCGAAGHLLLTIAHRYAEASTLAPFVYPQILYLAASSWLIFNEPPDIWIFVGAPIVIGSGLYIWLRERQLGKRPSPGQRL